MPKITFYGASWCGDSRRSERFLTKHGVPFRWVDIDKDRNAREFVRQVNNGNQVVPTIVLDDGSVLSEPSNSELADRLGIAEE